MEHKLSISYNQSISEKSIIIEGHEARVLYLALSPDGSKLASAGGDECLKIWDIFKEKQTQKQFFDLNPS